MPKFEVLGNLSAGPGMRFSKGQVVELKAESAAPFVAKGLLRQVDSAPVEAAVAVETPATESGEAEEKRGKGKGKK